MAFNIRKIGATSLVVGSICFTLGCSSAPEMPVSDLNEVESKLAMADQLDAEKHAPLAFRSGKDNLNKGKKAYEDERFAEARAYIEKATADFRLASVKSQAAVTEKSAKEIEANLSTLQDNL